MTLNDISSFFILLQEFIDYSEISYYDTIVKRASKTFSDNPELEVAINCFLCQMKFTDIDEYVQHLIKHINQQSEEIQSHQEYFNCTVCGRSLRSELQQIQHHRRYHAHYSNVKETEDDKIVENPPKIMLQNIYDHSKTKIKYPPRSPFYNP